MLFLSSCEIFRGLVKMHHHAIRRLRPAAPTCHARVHVTRRHALPEACVSTPLTPPFAEVLWRHENAD